MGFWRKDKTREHARDVLRHVRHYRRMREDILPAGELRELQRFETALDQVLGQGSAEDVTRASNDAQGWYARHVPRLSLPGLRENLEILAVAVGVAMACRAYFIQPFKIPTGSMQPTLYGIQYVVQDGPALMDRFPLKLVKWLGTGKWYTEIRTRDSGVANVFQSGEDLNNGRYSVVVGKRRYSVPVQGGLRITPGDFQPGGTVLWRGHRVAGDHVFVDRVRWNLFPPRRGQIIVFDTDNIATLPPKTHYIKRLVGLPGERISITPPDLVVNGVPMREPEGMARIAREEFGIGAGYRLIDARTDSEPRSWALRSTNDFILLDADRYFALGDNTRNSKDGRYWGSVPGENLVGPAAFVYWPFSKRWGVPP